MTAPDPFAPTTLDQITLHTYFRSSCSARLRIALAYKSIPYTPIYVNLLKGAHKEPPYTLLNPSESVPTLCITPADPRRGKVKITQSVAALEYLDEAYPGTRRLLPALSGRGDGGEMEIVEKRALIRTLVEIIASDTQPVTNLRIIGRAKTLTGNEAAGPEWAKEFLTAGLKAYEKVLKERNCAGRFSVGDEVSMADVCLVPAYWGAVRYGVEVDGLRILKGVVAECEKVEAFRVGSWTRQGDTPVELRAE